MLEDVLDFDLEVYANKWFYLTFSYIVDASTGKDGTVKVQSSMAQSAAITGDDADGVKKRQNNSMAAFSTEASNVKAAVQQASRVETHYHLIYVFKKYIII